MSVRIQTNKGKTVQHPSNYRITQGERITIYGDLGDVAILPFNALFRQGFNMGPTFQAGPTSSLEIKLTCEAEDLATKAITDPAVDAGLAWFTWANPLAPGEMKSASPMTFTAARIHFLQAGRCMICSI